MVPFQPGAEAERGPVVNDAYFGKVRPIGSSSARACVFFKGDGQYRSKIGLSPGRARPVLGELRPRARVLTIVPFTTGPQGPPTT